MPLLSSIVELLKRETDPVYLLQTCSRLHGAGRGGRVARPERCWAKVVICIADGQPLQAVLPADQSWISKQLRLLAHAAALRLAHEEEIAALYPEYEVGAMPPFGAVYGHRVFVDRCLVGEPEMVFNAGTHTEAICMHYGDFAELGEARRRHLRAAASPPTARPAHTRAAAELASRAYPSGMARCREEQAAISGNPRHRQRQPARFLPHGNAHRRRRRVLSDHAIDRRRRAVPAGVCRRQAQRLRPATRSPSRPKASMRRRAARSRTPSAASAWSTTPRARASSTASSSTTTRPASARRWCWKSPRAR